MPSRAELNVRARNVGIDPATYPNDSKLEQRVIYEEKNNATFAGTLATGTITSTGVAPSNNDTVTIGDRTYTYKTALTEAKASATLTSTGVTPTNGDQVTIGDRTYTFRTALTTPAVPDEVLIGGSAAVALDNILLAVNAGAGAGTNYSTGTVAHQFVTATTNTNTTQLFVAKTVGTAANGITTSSAAATLSFGGANMTGGVNAVPDQVLIGASADAALDNLKDAINRGAVAGSEGTTYSTGTIANLDVTATTNTATTQLVQATSYNSGNTVATTKSAVTLSWGAATLTGASPKEVAQVAYDNAQISGGARV